MTVSNRDFVGSEDLPMVVKFFDEARDLVGDQKGFLHAGDVWWRYRRSEPESHQLRLWFHDENLIAFGWVISGQTLEIQLHPSLTDTEFEALAQEIVSWAKRVCPSEINTDCTSSNARLIRVLESCGFVRTDSESLDSLLNLNEPLPDVALPARFQARSVLENEFAAFCIAWLSNGMGYFEPVGTRAAFRRQGLGRAVIVEGLKRLKALGAHSASVYSFAHNRAFYESCGFVVVNHWQGYAFKQEPNSGS